MTIKYKLTKDEHAALEEGLQALHTEADDGFTLSVEGLPDIGQYEKRIEQMDGKINELLGEKKSLKAKFEEADEKLREALANGNNEEKIEQLRESQKKQIDRLKADHEAEVSKRDAFIEKTQIHNKALELANSLAVDGSSKVLLPHIISRLAVEGNGDEYNTVVLGPDGKPSALSLDDLKSEFANDPAFAHVIVGSKASGGGASGGHGGGRATTKKFDQLTGAELSALRKESPEEYERLKAEYHQSR